MSEYDNTNKGVLFENSNKKTDKHPDMTGKLNIDGTDFWIAGWWNESKKGVEFLSLALGDEIEEQEEAPKKKKSSSKRGSASRGNSRSPKSAPKSTGRKRSKPAEDDEEAEDDDLPF